MSEPILIVEDNPVNVKLFRVLLEKSGFLVRTAGDADEALAALAEFRPLMILMDVQLPGMDGLELTRRLKADARYRDIVIVALTAYAMKGDRERALDAGCQGYITKPIDTRTFAESVLKHLAAQTESAVKLPSERPLILIADDDHAQRRLLEIHLTQVGFDVITARDGAEAIERMHARRPDLVTSDVLMPRLDGFRLVQYIRQEPTLSSVPVVLMTSGAIRSDDEEMARGMGANSLVARTESFDQIVAAIRGALERGAVTTAKQDQEIVEELRDRFVEDGRGDLQNLLANLQSDFDSARIRKLAHRWAGTGGTLGLPQVSQAAFEIDRMLGDDANIDRHALAAKLAHLNDLFAAAANAAAAAAATVSDAVASSLSGKRFAAVGFDEVEAARLSETLEQAHAVLRIRYAIPDTTDDWASLYDGVIVSAGGEFTASPMSQFLAGTNLPLVAIGLSSPTLETGLNVHRGEHDFLLRPWNPSELVLRCYTVVTRAKRSGSSAGRASTAKASVLIGGDDPTTVAVLRMSLKDQNVDCEAVSNGGEVLQAVADTKPDLVVLDINMPQLDGFEVLTALKKDSATRNIPVVLLAARQQESDVLRGFSLGAEDYLTKPFSAVELAARIKRSLRRTA